MCEIHPKAEDLLLSEWEVQNNCPSDDADTCKMDPPRRGKNSFLLFAPYCHWTSTDSMPPLSRLVPVDTIRVVFSQMGTHI